MKQPHVLHCGFSTLQFSRRRFLERSGLGLGSLALAYLLDADSPRNRGAAAQPESIYNDLRPRAGHFFGEAKAVIQLNQEGGPSQMDLFDPKPELAKRDGQTDPQGVESLNPKNNKSLLGSPFRFRPNGQCGMELSELIPHLGTVADELCLVRSMYTEHNNHPEANAMMHTGKIFVGRPTMGAWVSYALGTENENLPAFIVLRDPKGYGGNTKRAWSSGWMPALYQGTEFSSKGKPVQFLTPDEPVPPAVQRENNRLLARLNAEHLRDHPGDSELETRIKNHELAARMQLTVMTALDVSNETSATRELYGLDSTVTADYGMRCLMARRLIEVGVRFVQVSPPLAGWDHHSRIREELPKRCGETDRPSAALIKDLKNRGLLDSTIVMWTGEFGRLPTRENATDGRDHNRNAFSLLLAGGGFKGGLTFGQTDDFGYKAIVDRVSVPDLHATLLRQLGLDHERLTYRHHGRDETLTDPAVSGAQIVAQLLKSPPA
ncbi:MAG TPA: DUF1501 domain-containing protein [Pirellulales bacterium]|nr:DUF1501 domain-containing protein [Pirellulales bacterium]